MAINAQTAVGLACAWLLLGGFSDSQPAANPAAATTVSGIDVVAPARMKNPPSRAAVEAYVGSIGGLSISGQLAIWARTSLPNASNLPGYQPTQSVAGTTICPRIIGLPQPYADFILARIRKVGLSLGAPVSPRDCPSSDNNLIIAFPDDADAFIRKLADDKPQAFGFRDHGGLVEDLKRPPRPIRAWYGVEVVVTGTHSSRLAPPDESAIYQALIVVDRAKTDALDMGQLSDYLAMIALAQIRPEAVPRDAPSILNIFNDIAAGRTPAPAMTRMDAAYLQSLYAIDPRQPGSRQNAEIVTRIHRRLTGG